MKNCKKILVAIVIFLQCYTLIAQEFRWRCDGYEEYSGGGFYENVDDSGIDLTVSGLVNDFIYGGYGCTFLVNSGYKIDSLGATYLYTYEFSQAVDVDFEMKNLGVGSVDGVPYSGQLTFSGNPMFYDYTSNLTVSGNTVIPTGGGSTLNIRYINIMSFEIIHGDGVTMPRLLLFKNIGFTPTTVNIEEPTKLSAIYPNPARESLSIEINDINKYHIRLLNAFGQEMNVSKKQSGNTVELNTQNLHMGVYMLTIYEDGELLSVEKVIIQ